MWRSNILCDDVLELNEFHFLFPHIFDILVDWFWGNWSEELVE